MSRIRQRLTFANVVSVIALFVALGGGAYAVSIAKKNSVVSKSIKNGQVKTKDLAKNGVNGSKVADNSLSGADINESSLGAVPNATSADHATSADNATSANDATNATQLNGLPSTAFQARQNATWTPMTLNPGFGHADCYWSNYGGAFADASYLLDQDGFVHLRGLVRANGGISLPCTVLPDSDKVIAGGGHGAPLGYHPATQEAFAVSSNDKPARVDIDANGNVFIELGYPSFTDAQEWVSLDGISFRCAPSGQNGCP